ncbi:GNAT family N-acetyltransferase [Naasia sp. SYSU D00948]|uniref:GNAT family N-acetyltransferase n=1 Tax=Naasia sp. SYSU D00948 TaxID=2817379 RepID=UPI001B315B34|nr:GNAT family N-acetyltransferase [Naasia sp. SYSU D00948]
MSESTTDVRLEEDRDRYVLTLEGEFAGVAHFLPHGEQVVFTHTVVDDRFEGHGLGSMLIRTALDDVRSRGKRIVPVCPFVQAYLAKHHEWDDIVDPPTRRLKKDLPD